MASNSFGNIFKITTWGESHGKAIGVVIDGCPAGLSITEEEINEELFLRRPGNSPYTSARNEKDEVQIMSGVFQGKTTGAPLSLIIFNTDADSTTYEQNTHLLKPGHAHFTYLEKYGIFDYRGGGRASGRETACRVAAGAVAKKLLQHYQIRLLAYIREIGGIPAMEQDFTHFDALKKSTRASALFCPDPIATEKMKHLIEETKKEGDSLGGVVEVVVLSVPSGLGDPIYEKLEARLSFAMLSLPATKGFEIGSGFKAATMKGSEHSDAFYADSTRGAIRTKTNYAGGALGGISTGMPLVFRVAFKPPSSIRKTQETVSLSKKQEVFVTPESGRHDPCIAIRGVPAVEAMTALVLADALLMDRCSRIEKEQGHLSSPAPV